MCPTVGPLTRHAVRSLSLFEILLRSVSPRSPSVPLPITRPLPYLRSRLPLRRSSTLLLLPALLESHTKITRGRKAPLVHRFMIMSRAYTLSVAVCVIGRETECVPSGFVCQDLVTFSEPTVYMCLDEEELNHKSQILSLKMNYCVCFVV